MQVAFLPLAGICWPSAIACQHRVQRLLALSLGPKCRKYIIVNCFKVELNLILRYSPVDLTGTLVRIDKLVSGKN